MSEKVRGGEKIEFSAFRKHENIRKAIGYIIPVYNKLITMDKIMKSSRYLGGHYMSRYLLQQVKTLKEMDLSNPSDVFLSEQLNFYLQKSIPVDKLRCYCIVPSNQDNIDCQLKEVMYAD